MDYTNVLCVRVVLPHVQATGGMVDKYLGPAVLLQAYRWIMNSRDEDRKEIKKVADELKLYRCHTIMNCTNSCPKRIKSSKSYSIYKKNACNKLIT